MDCQKIKEYIITDYVDGRMGAQQRGLIDQHLDHCHSCKGYLADIKNAAVNPFMNTPQVVPEQLLWSRIKQAIELEDAHAEEAASVVPDFWERLRAAVHFPRTAFALATVATLVVMIGLTNQLMINNQMMTINAQDQVMYLSSLIDEPVGTNNGSDLGTPIEKYFL